ncbi:hypothetical protein A4A49_57869 [Nicotiana attenuata]|uniref:Replication protein a 70 kDa dna-binding subunit b n=2 Tax=Nicotiana attenuata TaxID=49451 RepID=A0A1J6LBA7_NICAT|nr:hypothetical protein A4A49_57869 [Nicotiana attenuata]
MEERLSISEITPLTTEWTCKVQTVDKFRPRDSRDQRVHFQTIIVQDVNEEQICVILYGDDIKRCDNLFELFETYLISTAKVRNPQPYSLHIGQFEWIVDRFTIVESIPKTNEKEALLPPPSRLSAISFADVEQQPSGVEFDLLAVVANCGAMQCTADQTKRFQEAIVMDNTKKPLFFTIWEDLASNEGIELLRQVRQLQEYPVILAKRIVSRLATRYNSTILINPLYVQATELRNWVDENKEMLIEYTVKSSAESASSLNLVAVDDEILSVSSIATQTSSLSLTTTNAILTAEENKGRGTNYCISSASICSYKCHFEVEITDETGTTTATVSEGLGERMLSTTAEQIYDIINIKNELFPVAHINQLLADKLFRIQLQRSSSRTPDKNAGSLVLLSYTEKPTMFLPEESASVGDAERIMEEESILGANAKATKKRKREPSTLLKPQSRLSRQ